MAATTSLRALAAAALLWTGCVPVGGGRGGDDPEPPRPDMAADVAVTPEPEPAPDAAPEPEPEPEPDAAPDPEPDAGPAAPSVTVATFNVRRFFDTVCDSGACAFDDYERQYPPAEFDAKAQTVAYGVRTLDADVVLLQEIESQESLDALLSHVDGYDVAVIGELGFPASLDTVILARDAGLVRVVRHQDERIPRPRGGTTTFSRELLEVHLDVGGRQVIAICGHFKAKNDDDPDRRQAEGRAAREIVIDVAARHPQALVVFGGDLNDTPDSPPIMDLMGGGGLVRVAAELGEGAGTYEWDGELQAIDHLFLVETPAGRYQRGTARVIRDSDQGLARSDHAGLRASFTWAQ
ncbi:MAG: endonuclease/exonuclease/phosphatase family protein [Myxococcales bacterium]|nr:endonuclease/exonuclease/phosphatase family protein [Myxococcales bacterium]MCB9550449.1 endonuclease/exonuclease/phosphatase family protein [Myxococcales bacterium]